MFESLISRIVRIATNLSAPHPAWPGMDRQVRKILTMEERFSPLDVNEPVSIRRAFSRQSSFWNVSVDHSVTVEDVTVDEHLSLRWYWIGERGGKGQCLVYFHGGGMVAGDIQSHDRFCRRIAQIRKMAVVAVHYRRAPDYPFPAAVDDAITSWNHVVEQWQALDGNLQQLGIGGDGSGATLATVVCQQAVAPTRAVAPSAKPVWQWLLCPATDSTDRSSRSWVANSHNLFLTSRLAERCHDSYMPEREQQHWLEVSPIHATADVLSQLPPTVLITAGFDPLCDQGMNYARKLKLAGVPVVSHHEARLPHGYIHLGGYSEGALMGADKAITLIDMIFLQARRRMPTDAPGFVSRFQGPPVNLQTQKSYSAVKESDGVEKKDSLKEYDDEF